MFFTIQAVTAQLAIQLFWIVNIRGNDKKQTKNMNTKQANQSVGHYTYLVGIDGLTVQQDATCYDMRRTGGNRCLYPTKDLVAENTPFRVFSLSPALLEQAEVVVARVSLAKGKETLDFLILATAIKKPEYSHGY